MKFQTACQIIASAGKAFRRYPIVPLSIFLTVVLLAVFADYIAPYDPTRVDLDAILLPPGSGTYMLGTDIVGRDIFSRLVYGARVSLIVGIVAATSAAFIGVSLGLLAGYIPAAESIIMRLVEVVSSIPYLFGALLIASVIMMPGLPMVILVIVLWSWPMYARMVRGEVLFLRERDYVTLAKLSGASNFRIMFRHLLPNCAHTIIVLLTLDIGHAIIFESTLSFLGIGIMPPTPSWGLMTADGRNYLVTHWWLSTMPGLAIFVLVSSINFIGDWLTGALDPRRRLRG